MKTFILILGLGATCMAGGIETSESQDHGDSNSWQPSNVPSLDFSNHAGNGHYQAKIAGLTQDYQALSHGDPGGKAFEHNAPQTHGSFGHDAIQGYDLGNHGQAKSFDIGSHGHLPSFGASGHDFGGDSYLQAANDFGNHDQGAYNAHAGDFNVHGGNIHEETGGNGGQAHVEGSHRSSYESTGHDGGAEGHTQTFILQDGGNEYGHAGQDATVHDLGIHGLQGHDFGGQSAHGFHADLGHAEPFSVGEHVDEEHPVEVPLYKHVTVPFQKLVHVNVPKPVLVGVPQPYPVKVPVHKPVAVPVETEINIPIEKVVPYPVVKHVPYPVEKHVPFKVEKTVHVHVPQPYPVKIPIYKTIHHHKDH